MRFTPEKIEKLEDNEIFVFGSNEAGRHGKGAALQARKFGAIRGLPWGMQGRTYAIPTKDEKLNVLEISEIKKYVDKFIDFTKTEPDCVFLVTPIGCGLAGYTPKEIAPLFSEASELKNVVLPKSFVDVIWF